MIEEWKEYCKALKLDPEDIEIKESEYYQKGFNEWKRLLKEFKYYSYMDNNC